MDRCRGMLRYGASGDETSLEIGPQLFYPAGRPLLQLWKKKEVKRRDGWMLRNVVAIEVAIEQDLT